MESIFEEVIEVDEDIKGAYRLCPSCGKKCYYHAYGEEEYACECVDCDLLLDE